jgi:MYXO-CTERM domain-containing protein
MKATTSVTATKKRTMGPEEGPPADDAKSIGRRLRGRPEKRQETQASAAACSSCSSPTTGCPSTASVAVGTRHAVEVETWRYNPDILRLAPIVSARILPVLAALLMLLASPDRARACSCPEVAPADALAAAAAVFKGRVIGAYRTTAASGGPREGRGDEDVLIVRFAVERAWKGIETQEATVATLACDTACGFEDMTLGETRLVIAWAHAGGLAMNRCFGRRVGWADIVENLGGGTVLSLPGSNLLPRPGAPSPVRPPNVHPSPRGCACSTPGEPTAAPSGGWALAILLVIRSAGRRARRWTRPPTCAVW